MPEQSADQPAKSTKKRAPKASKASQTAKKSAPKAPKSRPALETGSTGGTLTLTELLSGNTARLPKRYNEDIERFGDFAKGQAIIWPLIAACSLVRRHPGTPFVPEYIIPQFLLQWVQREKDLDGIRYFSTKLAAMNRAQGRAFNFVFPVRQKAPQGICGELQESFALTPPVSWPMLQSWQPKITGAQLPATGALDLAEGFPVAYSETEFFALEHKLKGGLSATKITGP
jgi:hypothetical protein